jgi:hypothetical protein
MTTIMGIFIMAWIILEGLDRTGKSTVAELYKKQGFKIIHMSAPDKKYTQEGYTGPSYLDSVVEMYMKYNGKDVIFDRSPYGEAVWPFVYGRKALLNEEDIEILMEMEDGNDTKRILMFDQDLSAHWKRCLEFKENLNKGQFSTARMLFDKMAAKYGFERRTLQYFAVEQVKPEEPVKVDDVMPVSTSTGSDTPVSGDMVAAEVVQGTGKTPEQLKLDTANAINSILDKRIIKGKGEIYDALEVEVRTFLNTKLGAIFGKIPSKDSFSSEEVGMLKAFLNEWKNRAKKGN